MNEPRGSREREGSCEHERVAKRHLPRLAAENYRGIAFVHWTLTVEKRATGWLTPGFHQAWHHILLHTCARYALASPAFVLMPDHIHLLWLGLDEDGSDQSIAVEFLRKHLSPALAPVLWQRQPYDHVLTQAERERGAFETIAHYIFENPVRAGLVTHWREYSFTGGCVGGYPNLDVRRDDYWELFWRIYQRLGENS